MDSSPAGTSTSDFNEETIRQMYDKEAKNYVASTIENIKGRAIVRYTIEENLKNYDLIQPGLNIMDLACGHGRVARMLLNLMPTAKSVTGVDISPEMIKLAKSDPIQSEKLKYIASDVIDLNMEEFGNQLDLITSSFFLNHAYSEEYLNKILKSVYTMLKPGGKFWSIYMFFSPTSGQQKVSFKTGGSVEWKGIGIVKDFDPFITTLATSESNDETATVRDAYVSKEMLEKCSKGIGFEQFHFKLSDVSPEMRNEVSQEVWDDLHIVSKYFATAFMMKPVS